MKNLLCIRLVFSLAFLLLSVFSWAQGEFKKGYIFTLDNLIEPAYIQVLDPVVAAQICRYKVDSLGVVKEYKPNEILGYRFIAGGDFNSRKVEEGGTSSYYFLENLYEGRLKAFGLMNRFFISRENHQLSELTEKTYQAVLADYFKDCPYLGSRIKKIQFTRHSLLKAIKEYDLCIKSGADIYEGNTLKVDKALLLGISNSLIKFDSQVGFPQFSGESYKSLSYVNVGFQAWLSHPQFSKRLSFRTGLFYESQKFSDVKIIEPTVYQLQLKFTQLKLPVGLQYDLIDIDKFSIFGYGGFSNLMSQTTESKEVRDTSIGASIYIDEDIPFNNLDNQKEFFFGVGTTAKISPKLRVIVDLSYTSGSRTLLGDEPTNSLNSSYQTKVFKIGLVF